MSPAAIAFRAASSAACIAGGGGGGADGEGAGGGELATGSGDAGDATDGGAEGAAAHVGVGADVLGAAGATGGRPHAMCSAARAGTIEASERGRMRARLQRLSSPRFTLLARVSRV